MKRLALLALPLAALTVTACASNGYYDRTAATAGVRADCNSQVSTRVEVIAIQPDFVVVNGPDGQFNVSREYLTEMPRVGDYLHIQPTSYDGNCVYQPVY